MALFPVSLGNSSITSSDSLTGAGTLGNEIDPLDVDGLKLGALEITEDRCKKKWLKMEKIEANSLGRASF